MISDKQSEYLARCDHRWNLKVGATGSGKSWLDYAVVIPKRLLAMRGQGAAVIIGNTSATVERNILDPMRQIWGERLVGRLVTSSNHAKLFGHKVYILGADKQTSVTKIQGLTVEYGYGDEMTTWAQPVFEMLKSRLRCEHSYFDGTANPDSANHYLKQFIDSDVDVYCQTSTIDDNPFLPEDFVHNLKREYAGTVYYKRFILGEWAAAEGACYPLFAADPERYIIDSAPPVMYATIGVDFGGGTSGHAFQCVGFGYQYSEMVILAEYYNQDALDPHTLEAEFVEFVKRCKARWLVTEVYCDSAEQTLINGLRSAAGAAGIGVGISNARKGPINDRIRAACRLMGADRFKVMRDCKITIKAYSDAVYDPKALVADVRLDNGTSNIDTLDATEYAYEREIYDLCGV
ncbi:MAG: PBSX family phage terminase large subunit [Oscillospiraceae bacterium]|nr:PBSX family phage terminase large subunit [Oscillospiraceae bacterium]